MTTEPDVEAADLDITPAQFDKAFATGEQVVIVCEPDPECSDPNPARWYCHRGHDGSPAGVCALRRCQDPTPSPPIGNQP